MASGLRRSCADLTHLALVARKVRLNFVELAESGGGEANDESYVVEAAHKRRSLVGLSFKLSWGLIADNIARKVLSNRFIVILLIIIFGLVHFEVEARNLFVNAAAEC